MIHTVITSTTGAVADTGPSATDWITALTGAVALLAAGVAAYVTWRQFRLLVSANERDQAAKFAMWSEYKDSGVEILYSNGSGLPVYAVCATITVPGEPSKMTKIGTCGPTGEPQRNAESIKAAVDSIKEQIDDLPKPEATARYRKLAELTTVAVTFRDAAGITWRRTPDGTLTKESNK
jgi:hypothetical protein